MPQAEHFLRKSIEVPRFAGERLARPQPLCPSPPLARTRPGRRHCAARATQGHAQLAPAGPVSQAWRPGPGLHTPPAEQACAALLVAPFLSPFLHEPSVRVPSPPTSASPLALNIAPPRPPPPARPTPHTCPPACPPSLHVASTQRMRTCEEGGKPLRRHSTTHAACKSPCPAPPTPATPLRKEPHAAGW